MVFRFPSKARLPQPYRFLPAGFGAQIAPFGRTASLEELCLRFRKSNLGLLASLTHSLCHGGLARRPASAGCKKKARQIA
jgi:hypothetical protein